MALQELQCEATPHLLSRRRSPPRGLPSTNSPAAPHQQSSLCTTTRTLVPQPPLASPQLAHLLLQELRTPSLQQTEATQSWPLQHQPLNTSSQLPHHLHQPSRTHPLRQSLQAARDTSASAHSLTQQGQQPPAQDRASTGATTISSSKGQRGTWASAPPLPPPVLKLLATPSSAAL